MSIQNIIARANGTAGIVICTAPDVCKTPTPAGPVPIPYMIVAMLSDAVKTSTDTKHTSKAALTMGSRISRCTGDQPGTLGGVVSNVFGGFCRPITCNPTVIINGKPVIETGHTFGMNCAGPEGVPNTVGSLIYWE